jgi:methylated-DNA-[protein]-cysteine S-methyltransferase
MLLRREMLLRRAVLSTPLGDMLALSSDEGLCALEFMNSWNASVPPSGRSARLPPSGPTRLTRLERRLSTWFPPHDIVDEDSDVIARTRRWLADYFAGLVTNAEVPLDMHGAPFEQRVWRALLDIRPGETTSYGAIAKQIGAPSAARAVGLANGANPIALIVPCHRVVGSNGALTGYGGGLERKSWLIDHERRWSCDRLF